MKCNGKATVQILVRMVRLLNNLPSILHHGLAKMRDLRAVSLYSYFEAEDQSWKLGNEGYLAGAAGFWEANVGWDVLCRSDSFGDGQSKSGPQSRKL
jgi:hypothetical protein